MKDKTFIFEKKNYQIMLIGIGFIVAGFILMWGGGAADETSFNPEIFSFRRITLAPIFILIGFIIEIVAIMYKPKK